MISAQRGPVASVASLLMSNGQPLNPQIKIGNDTGLLAALLFLSLLAISNDLSLRRLGTRTWKSLQRWTYMAVALTLIHAVAYQLVEKREGAYDALMCATVSTTAALQVVGWWKTKRKRNRSALVSPVQQ